MKNLTITIFTLLLIFGCEKKENDAVPETPKATTEITHVKLSSVKTSTGDLSVKLLEVNDSRCPMNANCVWAGVADLKFSISDGADNTEVAITFSSADKSLPGQDFKLGGQNYTLTVTQVLPYPVTSTTPKLDEYKINVAIEKN